MSVCSKKMSLYTIIALLLCINISVSAQEMSDIYLLKQHKYIDSTFNDRVVSYGFNENNKTMNPVYHLFSASMFVYQKYVSACLSRDCAFKPSCSRYSKELISEYGLVKGVICTADRMMRCNRISLSDKNSLFLISEGKGRIIESTERYRF